MQECVVFVPLFIEPFNGLPKTFSDNYRQSVILTCDRQTDGQSVVQAESLSYWYGAWHSAAGLGYVLDSNLLFVRWYFCRLSADLAQTDCGPIEVFGSVLAIRVVHGLSWVGSRFFCFWWVGLDWASQLRGRVGSGHTKWTHGQLRWP